MVGTAVQYLAQQPITVAILKDSNMKLRKDSFRYGVLYDGSECANKVLKQTLLMMGENDRLTTITVVEQGMDERKIRFDAEVVVNERRDFDTVILTREPNETIKDCIKRYLKSQAENDANYVDFCAVGNRGLNMGNAVTGDDFLGTVARAMITMRKLNSIFIP